MGNQSVEVHCVIIILERIKRERWRDGLRVSITVIIQERKKKRIAKCFIIVLDCIKMCSY